MRCWWRSTNAAPRLRVGGQSVAVALVSLANLWQGDFATYWRAPAGYRRVLGDGDDAAPWSINSRASSRPARRGAAGRARSATTRR